MFFQKFKDFSLEDREWFNSYRCEEKNRFTALSFPSIFTCKDSLSLSIYADDKICSVYSDIEKGYFCPMGDENACMDFIDKLILEDNNFRLMYLSEEQAHKINRQKGLSIRMNRDLSEYLYSSKTFAFIETPPANYKRRVRKFRDLYRYSTTVVTKENLNVLISLIEAHPLLLSEEYPDTDVLKRVLEAFTMFSMIGVILQNEDNFAFIIGYENTKDIFTMTVMRSSEEWENISVAVCEYELAKVICDQYAYVDLEEDLGIEGLRKIKELTKPIEMIYAWEAFQESE